MERGRTEAVKVVRSRLGWEACRPSGWVILPQAGSVLKSVTYVATKGHLETWAATCDLVGVWGPYRSEWPVLLPGATVLSGPWATENHI